LLQKVQDIHVQLNKAALHNNTKNVLQIMETLDEIKINKEILKKNCNR